MRMGYLVCNKCGSYYELQPGETVEDFVDKCDCGGKLEYKMTTLSDKREQSPSNQKDKEGVMGVWKKQTTPIKALGLIGVCIIGFVLIGAVMGVFTPTKATVPVTDIASSNVSSSSPVQAGTIEIKDLTLKEIPIYKTNPVTGKTDYSSEESFSTYELNGELMPSNDFNYLGVLVTYYDSDGKVLSKNTVWSMNGVKKGEKYIIRGGQNLTGVLKANVMVLTSQDTNDESKVIFKKDLRVYGK